MTEKIFNRKNFFNSPEPDADASDISEFFEFSKASEIFRAANFL